MAVGDTSYEKLSASTNGRPIKVVAIVTAGTTIHTAGGTATFVTLDAYNSGTVEETLTIEWGGVTAPDDLYEFKIPPGSNPKLLFDRKFIDGALLIRAFSTTTNVVIIGGHVEEVAT